MSKLGIYCGSFRSGFKAQQRGSGTIICRRGNLTRMAKNNVVEIPFASDPSVVHFRIGGKRYLIRVQRQKADRPLAPVVAIDTQTSSRKQDSAVAAAAELNPPANDHQMPKKAIAVRLAPDNLPSVD